ncbi:guanylate-binding protein 1 [Amia ocellicauda]|uniref:guanylate-binding protein 1 n=1 Tax=Amia ocellicauda TaxID=2972642 RepID=UPI003464C020
MQSMEMKKPICLIANTVDNILQCNPEALEILRSISQPVVVVAVVGRYRTGKSFLMNQLAGHKSGFSLGSTIQSETKGIWMWCVPHPIKPNETLVLLDTEGLGDVEKGDQTNDNWIFALSVLLASTLVYNSMSTISNDAVEQLQYVTELTKYIKVNAEGDQTEEAALYAGLFPFFVWTVRDFSLQLVLDGKPITADEYLENSLKLKYGDTERIKRFNLPRECIRKFFPGRKCFVFDQPTSPRNMSKMEQLSDSDLSADFLQQAKEFCNYIYNEGKIKTIKEGITATGKFLGSLAVLYVDAINSGTVPCLENAVSALAQIENSAAVKDSLSYYKEKMSQDVSFPTDTTEELSDLHGNYEKEALELFMKQSFKDSDHQYQEELKRSVKAEYESIFLKNEEESTKRCLSLLQQLYTQLEKKVNEGIFMRQGGYQQYKGDLEGIVNQYKSQPRKGIKADAILLNFLGEKENVGTSILNAEKVIAERERQLAVQRIRQETMERERRAAEEEQRELQQRLAQQEKANREMMERCRQQAEVERQKCIAAQNAVLEAKLKEQQASITAVFQNETKCMETQIQDLRHQVSYSGSGSDCVIL